MYLKFDGFKIKIWKLTRLFAGNACPPAQPRPPIKLSFAFSFCTQGKRDQVTRAPARGVRTYGQEIAEIALLHDSHECVN